MFHIPYPFGHYSAPISYSRCHDPPVSVSSPLPRALPLHGVCHQAPTVFLMGVCSSQPLEPRVLEGLVVVDLDAGRVEIGSDAALAACLAHAHVVDLRTRLR